jgi:hypothetical protein
VVASRRSGLWRLLGCDLGLRGDRGGGAATEVDDGVVRKTSAWGRGTGLSTRAKVSVATESISLCGRLLLRLWCPRIDWEMVRRIYLSAIPANDRTIGTLAGRCVAVIRSGLEGCVDRVTRSHRRASAWVVNIVAIRTERCASAWCNDSFWIRRHGRNGSTTRQRALRCRSSARVWASVGEWVAVGRLESTNWKL